MAADKETHVGRPSCDGSFARAEIHRAIVARANCGIMLVDTRSGRFTEVNPKWCEMLGYSATELLRMTIFDVCPTEDRDECRSVLGAAASSIEGWNGEKRYLRSDGTHLYGEVHASLVVDEKGNSHFLGIVQDLSGRREAEEELERRTLYLEILKLVAVAVNDSESSREALAICLDIICSKLSWKLGHALLADPESGAARSSGIWHGVDGKSADFCVASEAFVFERGVGLPGRVIANGEAEWVVDVTKDENFPRGAAALAAGLHGAAAFPVTIGSEIVAIVEFFSDRPMALDAQLLELMSRVGNQLGRAFERERAAARIRLGEEQLRQSQKMEALGRLAGGVAHDFNNLLTAINGYAELLLQRVGPAHELGAGLTEILGAGERAANLSEQLLAFSRSQLLPSEIIDIDDVIERFESMLGRLIGDNVQLVTVRKSDGGHVKASSGQIEQIVMNLAVNARDAMPEGGTLLVESSIEELSAALTVGRSEIPAGCYVRIAVTDTGCGMSGDVASRVFEPFFTTKEHGRGTGLGLSTVYGIVKQNGGHIGLTSEIGKGTRFEVYLPRVFTGESAEEKAPEPPRTLRGSESILVVEDNDAVRSLIVNVLEKNGYRVIAAANALEALTLFDAREMDLDLLLTDVMMPYMDGAELGRKLSERSPALKILYMSGWIGPDTPRIAEMGATIVAKPFGPSTILAKIRQALDERA